MSYDHKTLIVMYTEHMDLSFEEVQAGVGMNFFGEKQ